MFEYLYWEDSSFKTERGAYIISRMGVLNKARPFFNVGGLTIIIKNSSVLQGIVGENNQSMTGNYILMAHVTPRFDTQIKELENALPFLHENDFTNLVKGCLQVNSAERPSAKEALAVFT